MKLPTSRAQSYLSTVAYTRAWANKAPTKYPERSPHIRLLRERGNADGQPTCCVFHRSKFQFGGRLGIDFPLFLDPTYLGIAPVPANLKFLVDLIGILVFALVSPIGIGRRFFKL